MPIFLSILKFFLNFQKLRKSNLKHTVFLTVHAYGTLRAEQLMVVFFHVVLLICDLFALQILDLFIILQI